MKFGVQLSNWMKYLPCTPSGKWQVYETDENWQGNEQRPQETRTDTRVGVEVHVGHAGLDARGNWKELEWRGSGTRDDNKGWPEERVCLNRGSSQERKEGRALEQGDAISHFPLVVWPAAAHVWGTYLSLEWALQNGCRGTKRPGSSLFPGSTFKSPKSTQAAWGSGLRTPCCLPVKVKRKKDLWQSQG